MKRLNANSLKLIAIAAMTLDHLADILYPGFPAHPVSVVLHIIGRITAPVMWFFIAEGFYYTRNVKKYALRLLAFAILSHFAYCFAFGIDLLPLRSGIFNQTGILWPLFWSVVALWIFHGKNKIKPWQKYCLLAAILIVTFPSDWSCIPVMAVLSLYENRGHFNRQMGWMLFWTAIYAAVSFFFVDRLYGTVQFGVLLSIPLLAAYSGEKGRCKSMKWLFYLYYPLHLAVVGALRILLYGDVPILF